VHRRSGWDRAHWISGIAARISHRNHKAIQAVAAAIANYETLAKIACHLLREADDANFFVSTFWWFVAGL